MSVHEKVNLGGSPDRLAVDYPVEVQTSVLLEKNAERYSIQALQFLKNSEASTEINGVTLLFSREGRGCATRSSNDGGFNFHWQSWVLLGRRKKTQLAQLQFIFALEEAKILVEEGK
jgi:hypothetical protein